MGVQTLAGIGSRALRTQASNGTIATTTAMKKDIHPKFYPEAKARGEPRLQRRAAQRSRPRARVR
jgi:hypothetical protein